MALEEMMQMKKRFSLTVIAFHAAMIITILVFVYWNDLFKGWGYYFPISCLLLLFVYWFAAPRYNKKAEELGKRIEGLQKINTLLGSGDPSHHAELYSLECQGYPVLELLSGDSYQMHLALYKRYILEKYKEAQAGFSHAGTDITAHNARRLTKELETVEALPTCVRVLYEKKYLKYLKEVKS